MFRSKIIELLVSSLSFTFDYNKVMCEILGGNLTRKCRCMPQCEDDYFTVITAPIKFDRTLGNITLLTL